MGNIQKIKPCGGIACGIACGIAKELHLHSFKASPQWYHLVAHTEESHNKHRQAKRRLINPKETPKKHLLDTTTSSSIHTPVLCKTIPYTFDKHKAASSPPY